MYEVDKTTEYPYTGTDARNLVDFLGATASLVENDTSADEMPTVGDVIEGIKVQQEQGYFSFSRLIG